MPFPSRPTDSDRPEPKLGAPGPRPLSEPVPLRRGAAPARPQEASGPPLRLHNERQAAGLTAGDPVIVSSQMTAGEDRPRRRRPGILRLVLLLVLLAFAGIGAATVYHAVAGALAR